MSYAVQIVISDSGIYKHSPFGRSTPYKYQALGLHKVLYLFLSVFRSTLNDLLFPQPVTQLKTKHPVWRASYRTMGVMVRNLREAVNCTP